MALVAGESTSYRPSDTHIGSDRLDNALKVVNKRKNKNKTITEGLELVAIKDVGSIDEKLKAMNISYKEIIEYLSVIESMRGVQADQKPETPVCSTALNKETAEVIEIDDDVIVVKDTAVIKEKERPIATGINMISTMTRE